MLYHSVAIVQRLKFIKIRNWNNVTSEKILDLLEQSGVIETIFQYTDPDVVFNIIMEEYNKVINTLAPVRRVQVRSQEDIYLDEETIDLKMLLDITLTEYYQTRDPSTYRLYKRKRNLFSKHCKKKEKQFYESNFSNTKSAWRFIQSRTKDDSIQTPVCIVDKGKKIRKPKELAQHFSDFFSHKN